MKHLKQKLMASAAMLVVSAVMLSSVSFAWFTLSTNPEISSMTATVAANENLEIALDDGHDAGAKIDAISNNEEAGGTQGSTTGNPYTWGNTVDLSEVFTTAALSPTIQPVKYDAGTLKYPTYGTDGRVSGLEELEGKVFDACAADTKHGTTGGVKGYSADGENAPWYAFSVTYWVRSNVAGTLSLTEATKLANDGTDSPVSNVNSTMGQGSFVDFGAAIPEQFKEAFKVAFAVGDNTTLIQATKTAVDGDAGRYNLTGNITELTANTGTTDNAVKITMFVYLDGENITNAGALIDDITDITLNVQFDNSGLNDDAMTGNDTVPATGA